MLTFLNDVLKCICVQKLEYFHEFCSTLEITSVKYEYSKNFRGRVLHTFADLPSPYFIVQILVQKYKRLCTQINGKQRKKKREQS
jgi:hypothetical protein